MTIPNPSSWTAFSGTTCLATGPRDVVARAVKQAHDEGTDAAILIIDDGTGRQIDLDLRGTADAVVAQLSGDSPVALPRGRGRPPLGVTAREVTLLPRHWDWLAQQPGGASGTLRRLVEVARASGASGRRQAQQVADRFMATLAGNLPNYEDASRALYAGDAERFQALIAAWPHDIRTHAARLAGKAFDAGE